MGRLLSVNVGLPRDIAWQGKTVHTGIWKTPVQGPRMVRRLNIDGDGQGDLAGHGGEHRAVFVYQIDSYRYWQKPARSKRLRLWTVRRELHRRRPVGRRGVHRRPLPDRRRLVRGDAAARHLLPGRHPHERAADGRAARRARQARLLLSRAGGRRSRGRRRDRAGRGRARAHERGRDQRAALSARSSARPAGARAAHPGAERRLAPLLRGAARAGSEGRRDDGKRRARTGVRPASGVARDSARCGCRARFARAAT